MLTILEKSVSRLPVKSFRELTWTSSNNLSDSRTKTFWKVKTNFRKFNFIKYLKIKALMQELNEIEYRLLLDSPGVLEDNLFFDALRAWNTDVPKEILWKRLETLQKIIDSDIWNQNLYFTLNGVIRYEIFEMRSSIRKAQKYSGYVRNSSAVGSKRTTTKNIPEPEIFEWDNDVEIDYFLFLSVGELDPGIPGSQIILKMEPEVPKRKVTKI